MVVTNSTITAPQSLANSSKTSTSLYCSKKYEAVSIISFRFSVIRGHGSSYALFSIDSLLECKEVDSLNYYSKKIQISERPYCDYDDQIDETFGKPEDAMDFFNAYHYARKAHEHEPLPVHELEIHLLKIGEDIAIVTNPTELFTEFGLEIKKSSPYKYIFVAELTNGYYGYIPTQKAFEEGGYEVKKMTDASFLSVDAGEKIVEASHRLLKNQ